NQRTLNVTKIGLKSLTWQSNVFFPEGKLTFYLNPINLLPYCLGIVKQASGEKFICYGVNSMDKKTFPGIDYHNLFAISDLGWHRLRQQYNMESNLIEQDSFLFWVYPQQIANSIKMLYWLSRQVGSLQKKGRIKAS